MNFRVSKSRRCINELMMLRDVVNEKQKTARGGHNFKEIVVLLQTIDAASGVFQGFFWGVIM